MKVIGMRIARKIMMLFFLMLTFAFSACVSENPIENGPFNEPTATAVTNEDVGNSDDDRPMPTSTVGADLVFHNGAIYTVNEAQPWAEAVAVQDGVIVYVGEDDAVESWIGENTVVVDLNGRMLMPGFQDVHLHVVEAGINQNLCLFRPSASGDAYARDVVNCAAQQTDSEWVRGAGVNMSTLLDQSLFPIDLLDNVVPDRPVLILDDLGHGAWANTSAMERVGYDQLDGNPPGGVLVRDETTGRLTGVVLENAQQALRTASFAGNAEDLDLMYDGFLLTLEELAANGITAVSDAGGYWPRGHHEVWTRAEAEGTLTVRASNALYLFPDFPYDEQLAEMEALYTNDPTKLVRFNQAKIYIDGILGQGTAALYAPYEDSFGLPGIADDGFLYFDIDMLNQYATDLDALGFQLHFHVVGDRATTLALDAIETATAVNGTADRRHRLTHLYLVDQADWARFSELGVVADLQMASSSIDDRYEEYIGRYIGDRADELLPAFELLESGAVVTISSDWDADELSPFAKIESLVALEWDNVPTLDTLIRMMTINGAYLLHQEEKTGSIEVGKLADLIVLDKNFFAVPTAEIGDTAVLLTLLEGEVVYQDSRFVFEE